MVGWCPPDGLIRGSTHHAQWLVMPTLILKSHFSLTLAQEEVQHLRRVLPTQSSKSAPLRGQRDSSAAARQIPS